MRLFNRIETIEAENRKRLLDLLSRIPRGVPKGWKKERFSVGGLMYLGFSAIQTQKLVVISSQRQSVIDCKTGSKVYCEENYDELDLSACADPLGDERIPIAGEGGGGLRRFAPNGDSLDLAAPFWPKEQVIFIPQYASWYQHPETCTILLDDDAVLAYGFSRCGNYMAMGTSSGLDIFKKVGE